MTSKTGIVYFLFSCIVSRILTFIYQRFDCEADKFRIDQTTGDVILNNMLEYKGQTQYTVCIVVDVSNEERKERDLYRQI